MAFNLSHFDRVRHRHVFATANCLLSIKYSAPLTSKLRSRRLGYAGHTLSAAGRRHPVRLT
jgi:hypothetical protein